MTEKKAGPDGGVRAGEVEDEGLAEPRAVLYALRLITVAEIEKRIVRRGRDGVIHELCRVLQLPVPSGNEDAACRQFMDDVSKRLAEVENTDFGETAFSRNLASLAKRIGLSPLEAELFGVVALGESLDWFAMLIGAVDFYDFNDRTVRYLAHMTGAPARAVRRCLFSRDSTLRRAGLVEMPRSSHCHNTVALSRGITGALLASEPVSFSSLSGECRKGDAATLRASDFAYIQTDFDLATRLVRRARREKTIGINILIYGPPGTGKTEFVRAVAAAAGLELWEVGHQDELGHCVSGQKRLMRLRLSQTLLERSADSVLLFDEFEDALWPSRGRDERFDAQTSKAFVNDMVETNTVPTFWVSNEPRWLEPATQRRFTHTIEMDRPPRLTNERVLTAELGAFGISERWAKQVAADERLVPAYAKRARQVLALAEPEDAGAATKIAERTLEGCLALTPPGAKLRKEIGDAAGYRLSFLNTDADLRVVARNVTRTGKARLCLEGPPGTGKTAFARYLARRIGRYLMVRRASDLLSPFVGVTEMLIVEAFRKAEKDDVVLLIDEIESFMQSRAGAHRSWEITQVNEILTQLEMFPGVFIGTTNLADTLDVASRRRFDAFVQFDFLRPAQSLVLLRDMMQHASGERPPLTRAQRERLGAVSNLTPGDFAAVSRRSVLFDRTGDVDWWITALKKDAAAKPDAPRPTAGFLPKV